MSSNHYHTAPSDPGTAFGQQMPAQAIKYMDKPLFTSGEYRSLLDRQQGPFSLDLEAGYGSRFFLGDDHPAGSSARQAPSRQTCRELTDRITDLIPGLDQVHLFGAVDEALMQALQVAGQVTGKQQTVVFRECFHEWPGYLNHPPYPPEEQDLQTPQQLIWSHFHDLESLTELVDRNADTISAILAEPVPTAAGCITPDRDFLVELRRLCDRHNMLLIWDESRTGFRIARGGAQEIHGVQADLVVYGNNIGAGLSLGALAGKAEVLAGMSGDITGDATASSPVTPGAVESGIALCDELKQDPMLYFELEQKSHHLESGVRKAFEAYGIPHHIQRTGAMLAVYFTNGPVTGFSEARQTDHTLCRRFFESLMVEGIYTAPTAFATWFVSPSQSYEAVDHLIAATHKIANRSLR